MADTVRTHQVASLGSFMTLISDELVDAEHSWVFRGQRKDWDPVPKIMRDEYAAWRSQFAVVPSIRQQEDGLMAEFRRMAPPHLVIQPRSEWEWLALAQHHGLATRLLDWTTNPLVALFFAVAEPAGVEESPIVWCYCPGPPTGEPKSPYKMKAEAFYIPSSVAQRLVVQSGRFTVHPIEARRPPELWPGQVAKVVVPGSQRVPIRILLADMGINRSTLFPDLDGVASHANWGRSKLPDELEHQRRVL